MCAIADSDAFKDRNHILPQHQAALTLLQDRLSAPFISRLSWLDLACGKGQMILSLDENLSREARSKVEYWAYDLDKEFARETRKTAERLGFASLETRVGDLSDFDRILPKGAIFEFITLTNTIHEIEPLSIGKSVCELHRAFDGFRNVFRLRHGTDQATRAWRITLES